MGRVLRPFNACSALLALLGACYAVPERHSVSNDPVEGGVDFDGGFDPDADVSMDADALQDGRAEGGKDASGCRCSDPAKPICIEATETCVACTADAGSCGGGQVCDVLQGECVDCLQNTDCKDPNASVCDTATHACKACAEASATDCGHIQDKHVCLAGACVQCTKDKLAACLVQQSPTKSVQNACHALNHTCTDEALRKTPPCGECVSDAQCMAGHVCVQMSFGGQPIADKWFCQPVREGLNCSGERPYVVLASSEMTIEGEMADVCTLRVSNCSALSHYLRKYCGLDQDNRPIALDDAGVPVAPSVKGDNTLCGLPELEDGYCIEVQPGLHRCTVSCAEVQDCPRAAPACAQQTHAAGTADVCTIL